MNINATTRTAPAGFSAPAATIGVNISCQVDGAKGAKLHCSTAATAAATKTVITAGTAAATLQGGAIIVATNVDPEIAISTARFTCFIVTTNAAVATISAASTAGASTAIGATNAPARTAARILDISIIAAVRVARAAGAGIILVIAPAAPTAPAARSGLATILHSTATDRKNPGNTIGPVEIYFGSCPDGKAAFRQQRDRKGTRVVCALNDHAV